VENTAPPPPPPPHLGRNKRSVPNSAQNKKIPKMFRKRSNLPGQYYNNKDRMDSEWNLKISSERKPANDAG